MATSTETVVFKNFSATPAKFSVLGGRYAFIAAGVWGSGTLVLNQLAADGTTYTLVADPLNSGATLNSATNFEVVDLAPGGYQIAVGGTVSGMYAALCRIPLF